MEYVTPEMHDSMGILCLQDSSIEYPMNFYWRLTKKTLPDVRWSVVKTKKNMSSEFGFKFISDRI